MGFIVVCGSEFVGSDLRELLPNVPIIEAPEASVCAENAVVIPGRNARVNIERALGVVISGDEPPETLFSGIQTITVGQGAKNTVSVTSRTPGRLTLSLNRAVNTIFGITEPLELPINVPPDCDETACMAAFAAGILLGDIRA